MTERLQTIMEMADAPGQALSEPCTLGIDIGSVTVKFVLASIGGQVLISRYRRHATAVREALSAMLLEIAQAWPHIKARMLLTGSGALELAQQLRLPFVQEVVAATKAITTIAPQTDAVVEIGGEDSKIMYLHHGVELRMNETCAGGTGAFIDQMAALLSTDAAGLNELAQEATAVYPVASRCGVFAKTDIVPLLNEGIPKSDIARSIFEAVAKQVVGGLACGRPIKGQVAFAGGPLHFLPELKKCFIRLLGLKSENVAAIPQAQYLVAFGAAIEAGVEHGPGLGLAELATRLEGCARTVDIRSTTLPELFADQDDYAAFQRRHSQMSTPRRELSSASGELYLGMDMGSTTAKAVVMAQDGAVLSSCYFRNDGDPLSAIKPWLIQILKTLPSGAKLRASTACGYGAQLARAAFGLDFTEVETVAHLKAARELAPEVSYVIDIGGQDMKCLKVENGMLAGLALNEACSSGCGAFLETFAASLGLDMPTFVHKALFARQPADLGSRCTVFMNSRVRHAQKQGLDQADIAAGLCYSVIRNALHKVLRIRNMDELGTHVLVQGGAFLNDAVLRALEKLLGREVKRPDIAGLMGAYGAALLARERADEAPVQTECTAAALEALSWSARKTRCKGCGNHCQLTITRFSNGRSLVSGNRCDRVGVAAGRAASAAKDESTAPSPEAPDVYAWKAKRLFHYTPLALEEAPRGRLGIPRVLNIFEHYPFWFTLFTALGYRVELSPPSDRDTLLLGLDSMPSQTVCYPAKLAHGHVAALLRAGVQHIFYPCIPRESIEHPDADDCFNCPVVCGYPEVVRLNTGELCTREVTLHTPFVQPAHSPSLVKTLCQEFGLPGGEVKSAVKAARKELAAYRAELRQEGEKALARIQAEHLPGVILGGRPYHLDPEVNHGLPGLIASLGAAVLSVDSIAHLAMPRREEKLRVVDQWTYQSRLYQAAEVCCRYEELEMVHMTSFGCGLDAIAGDQIQEILKRGGKWLTQIKIDEGASLGAARIRIHSLLAAMREKRLRADKNLHKNHTGGAPRPVFTEEMRKTHTLVAPQMAPLHFQLLTAAMRGGGYNFQILPTVSRKDIETGLDVVHGDACYPAQIVIGQLVEALQSGQLDPGRTALLLTQTCGQCRASNYPALLRKALQTAGFQDVPVVTLSRRPMEKHPGFVVTAALMHKLILGCLYGDMLQRLFEYCRTYESQAGASEACLNYWLGKAAQAVARGDTDAFKADMARIVHDFAEIPLTLTNKPQVGIVGEILLKYHPDANNRVAEVIRAEGGEPVMTELADFLLYCCADPIFDWQYLGGSLKSAAFNWLFIQRIEYLRGFMRRALKEAPAEHLRPLAKIADLAKIVQQVLSTGHRAGEGWLLTAEMLELIARGAQNILCLQPFGCLPNHVTGRGVFRELRRLRPEANIMGVDYDPGTSETNQINRIKLFMSFTRKEKQSEVQ